MKTKIKTFFIAFFVSGGIFAAIMSAAHFNEHGIFPVDKFLYYFFGFGTVMGLLFVFLSNKQKQNEQIS